MKRSVAALTVLAFAAGVQPALAARIYNLTPVTIHVWADPYMYTLAPGKRSPSVSVNVTQVDVYYSKDPNLEEKSEICVVGFGLHHELVGGHYMLVTNVDHNVNCSVCDSDGNRISSGSGQFPRDVWDKVKGTRSEKGGCP